MPHTPGPWTIVETCRTSRMVAVVSSARCDHPVIATEGESHPYRAADDNAHLIAAAPDLLDVVALFIRTLDASREQDAAMRMNPLALAIDRDRCEKLARAAIAKATGQS